MYKIKCKTCGDYFEATRKYRKFCSKSCANSYNTSLRRIQDENIFKVIGEDEAYIIGLIWADGCISWDKHSKRFRLTISSNDKRELESIRAKMTPNKKLYSNNGGYSVVSTNEKDIEFLANLGMTERKSLTARLPNLKKDLMRHFIRGFFDGDGCVYNSTTKKGSYQKTYTYVSFTTGSFDMASMLIDLLQENKIESRLQKDNRKNTYYVKITKKKEVYKFYCWIYNDASLYFKRKYKKFNYDDIVRTCIEICRNEG